LLQGFYRKCYPKNERPVSPEKWTFGRDILWENTIIPEKGGLQRPYIDIPVIACLSFGVFEVKAKGYIQGGGPL